MNVQKQLAGGLVALVLAACGGAGPEESTEPVAAALPDAGVVEVSILHLNVADMDRSLAWYRDVLGMQTVRDSGGPAPTQIVVEEGAMMHTHILEAPGGEFQMELVEVSGVELRPQEPHIQDPGAVMLAMNVADLDGALAGARRLGFEIISDGEIVVTEERGRQAMVRDADGFVSYMSQNTETDPSSVLFDYVFVSVADLDETVAFYNGVFGLSIEAPGALRPTPERILALVGNAALAEFRLTSEDAFSGTEGAFRFQEFSGGRQKPVRHRVQDPGGPILTMVVEDLAGLIERVRAYGGAIGDGETFGTLPPDATVAWIRDPNGMLIRAAAAQ